MELYYLCFSDAGEKLAARLAAALGGQAERCGRPHSLHEWTEAHFQKGAGLIFVGAAGIAVRAVAPFVRDKASDPAVVAVDEGAHFAVPLLSGHLGGANDLARAVARTCGAVAAVTTATDVRDVFAVDAWARRQGCAVKDAAGIKAVSAALLAGRGIRLRSEFPIDGEPPAGVTLAEDRNADVTVGIHREKCGGLHVVPRIVVLGVGCRAGIPQEALEAALRETLSASGIDEAAIRCAASIDKKAEEPGLLAFCAAHGWRLATYPAERLAEVRGDFTASDFVRRTVGVDNVCERAAVLCSGGGLLCKKTALHGVTTALAAAPCGLDWRWRDG